MTSSSALPLVPTRATLSVMPEPKQKRRKKGNEPDSDERAKPDEQQVQQWQERFDVLPNKWQEHLDGIDPAERSFDSDAE